MLTYKMWLTRTSSTFMHSHWLMHSPVKQILSIVICQTLFFSHLPLPYCILVKSGSSPEFIFSLPLQSQLKALFKPLDLLFFILFAGGIIQVRNSSFWLPILFSGYLFKRPTNGDFPIPKSFCLPWSFGAQRLFHHLLQLGPVSLT